MPLMGGAAYGSFLMVCKSIHNFTGQLFTICIVIFFLLFAHTNVFCKWDMAWLLSFGKIFSGKHVPAGFFNFSEQFWFWFGMTFLGLVISGSGFVLDMIVPFMSIEYTRGTMQIANIIHSSAAILMSAMAMGHIYIGTISMQGSIDGMKTGYVDAAWAKQHHEIWYDKLNKYGPSHEKIIVFTFCTLSTTYVAAALPPLSHEAQEAANLAKTAYGDKVGAYQLRRVQNRVADRYKVAGTPAPVVCVAPPLFVPPVAPTAVPAAASVALAAPVASPAAAK